jgi:hypothetical protein
MKYILAILFACALIYSNAQPTTWRWEKNAGGHAGGRSLAPSTNGDVYVCGSFQGDSIQFGQYTFRQHGAPHWNEPFVVKYDSSGNVKWAKQVIGNCDLIARICADSKGNVYLVTGVVGSDIQIDNVNAYNHGHDSTDIVFAKFAPDGKVVWIKIFGGIGVDYPYSICADNLDNLYITGGFSSDSLVLDSVTVFNSQLTSGFHKTYIACFDTSGNAKWAKGLETLGFSFGESVTADNNGSIYVTGSFSNMIFESGMDTVFEHLAAGYSRVDIYIARMDTFGKYIWIKGVGSVGDDFAPCIKADKEDFVYITGYYSAPGIYFGDTVLTTANDYTAFIAKYDSAGNVLWARKGAGNNHAFGNEGYCISFDSSNAVYIAGDFISDTITFNDSILLNAESNNNIDIFIVVYDTAGNLLHARTIGGAGSDVVGDILINEHGNLTITGGFGGDQLVFDVDTLFNPYQSFNFFIAQTGERLPVGVTHLEDNTIYALIYPNPCSGSFTIVVDPLGSDLILSMYDIAGRRVKCTQMANSASNIICTDLQPGLYIWSIAANGHVLGNGKVAVE